MWHLCWVDVRHWLAERDRLGAETRKAWSWERHWQLCLEMVPSDGVIEGVGVLGDRSPVNLDGSPTRCLSGPGRDLSSLTLVVMRVILLLRSSWRADLSASEFPVLLLRIEARSSRDVHTR
jgi:hypothetical protein